MSRWLIALMAPALAGCAAGSDGPRLAEIHAQLAPPGSHARLYVYRDFDTAQSLQWVPIALNGAKIGGVGPGYVMVCDLAPGIYTIEPISQGLWPEQNKTVSVAAGQSIYAKIGSFRTVDPTVPGQALITTFVVTLQDTPVGERAVAPLWYKPCDAPYAPA